VSDEHDWGLEDAPATTRFASLPEFVDEFLLPVWRRLPPSAWCPKWWEHPEAVLRLEALWDAFESLRMQPGTGTATWIRDYLDPTMASLTTTETSPFGQCRPAAGEHVVGESWPAEPPPPDVFTTCVEEGRP